MVFGLTKEIGFPGMGYVEHTSPGSVSIDWKQQEHDLEQCALVEGRFDCSEVANVLCHESPIVAFCCRVRPSLFLRRQRVSKFQQASVALS